MTNWQRYSRCRCGAEPGEPCHNLAPAGHTEERPGPGFPHCYCPRCKPTIDRPHQKRARIFSSIKEMDARLARIPLP